MFRFRKEYKTEFFNGIGNAIGFVLLLGIALLSMFPIMDFIKDNIGIPIETFLFGNTANFLGSDSINPFHLIFTLIVGAFSWVAGFLGPLFIGFVIMSNIFKILDDIISK